MIRSHSVKWSVTGVAAVASLLVLLLAVPKEAWKYRIEFAAIGETLQLALDSPSTIAPVYDAASNECHAASSPNSRAAILLWAATKFNIRNAHESEAFLEAPAVFRCAAEYGPLVQEFLNSPTGQTLPKSRQDFLRESVTADPP